ncbi:hypothetical protein DH2020_043304 [Rehmannia glutinosa]|uniref:UDP-glycosyltransferases domain-containing protein n=1 Tax=Rehmannia glutinosa TaxID=99300 RepID=A0ABR0UK18_REHGL
MEEGFAFGLSSYLVTLSWSKAAEELRTRTPIGSDVFIEEALSEGLLDRIKQNGIIVQGWAPQAEILAHSSVGGFMSHCGWSSITESLYFGVPVVVPLKFDQPVNCRMAVETGVGVEVMRDENGRFDGNGVAKAINEVIFEERGKILGGKLENSARR